MHKPEEETKSKSLSKQFTIDELNAALFSFEDLMERCMSPFLLLKDTAQTIKKNGMLNVDKISVGVKRSQVTPEFVSTIKTYLINENDSYRETPKGFTYLFNEVPVEVSIIERQYSFINNPDSVYYWGENYLIPNPLDKYYKAQYIVR